MTTNGVTTEVNSMQPVINTKDLYAYSQPVWHFILLSVVTFGIYDFYWYYRNWKHLTEYKKLDISPGWRTAGLFVPILNLFLIYGAHKDYRDLIDEEGLDRDIYPGLIVVAIIFAGLLTNFPDPYWVLCFLATIPLAIVQGILNELWKKVQPELIHRTKFRGRQIFLIVCGSIFWFFMIVGFLLPE